MTVTRYVRRLAILALAAGALLLAGCGSSSSGSLSAPDVTPGGQQAEHGAMYPTGSPTAQAIDPSSCHVLLQGHDAEVVFSSSSDIKPLCDQWVSQKAASGELWIENGPVSHLEAVSQTCSLSYKDGAITAEVWDGGGAMYGQEACTGLLSSGWTERQSGSS